MIQPNESEITAEPFLRQMLLLRNELSSIGPLHTAEHATEMAYSLFGQTGFADLIAGTAQGGGDIDIASAMLDDVSSALKQGNIVAWMIRLLWTGLQQREQSDEHDDGQVGETADVLNGSCRMVTHVLLQYSPETVVFNRIAYLLLVGEVEQALDLLLPYSDLTFDVDSFVQAAKQEAADERGHADTDEQQHHLDRAPNQVTPPPPPHHEAVPLPSLDRGEGSEETYRQSAVDRQYAFDIDHVHDALALFCNDIAAEPSPDDPWTDPAFVFDVLPTLAGSTLILPWIVQAYELRQPELMDQAFEALIQYRNIAIAEGLIQLPPIVLAGILEDIGEQGNDQLRQSLRDAGADMSAILLARIPDAHQARCLARAVLDLDMTAWPEPR